MFRQHVASTHLALVRRTKNPPSHVAEGHSQQIEREPKSVNVRFAPNAT
jgi:hypothetical protein